MRVHYLQHEPQEGLGSIESWLRERGCEIRSTMLHEDEALPDVTDFDLLVIMGGGMSANDEARLPWLRAEKDLIRRAIEADKKILGVCLGAQLARCTGLREHGKRNRMASDPCDKNGQEGCLLLPRFL